MMLPTRTGSLQTPPLSVIQQLAQLLSHAERHITRELARILEADGFAIEQWRAIALLADGNPHSMSEIAEYALASAPSLTRMVDRMVADNLVYRKADPRDRRRVLVHISPRGQARHRQIADRIEAEQEAIMAEADPEHVVQLAALLTELLARMR